MKVTVLCVGGCAVTCACAVFALDAIAPHAPWWAFVISGGLQGYAWGKVYSWWRR